MILVHPADICRAGHESVMWESLDREHGLREGCVCLIMWEAPANAH